MRGDVLADPAWVARQIQLLGAEWGCTDVRVTGTIWWYMASSVLLAEPVRRRVTGARDVDPALAAIAVSIRPDGTPDAVTFAAESAADAFPRALGDALAAVVDAVATASGAGIPSLWAIAADAIANRALDADRRHGAAPAEAIAALVPQLPAPRFVTVDGQTFVRRASCCLLYETERAPKCISCPRRPPEERAGLLSELVRRGR